MTAAAYFFAGTSMLFACLWIHARHCCERELRRVSLFHKQQLAEKHNSAFEQGLAFGKKTAVLQP